MKLVVEGYAGTSVTLGKGLSVPPMLGIRDRKKDPAQRRQRYHRPTHSDATRIVTHDTDALRHEAHQVVRNSDHES
jgi:hypothetical protein